MPRLILAATIILNACVAGPTSGFEPETDASSKSGDATQQLAPDSGRTVSRDAGGDSGGIGAITQDLYQSGSRIKARMLVTPDGAKSFLAWRDTQRNEDCEFLPTADGKYRCLPGSMNSAWLGGLYSDSGCTVPLAQGLACSTISYLRTGSVCLTAFDVRIFHAIPWTGTAYYTLSSSGCSSANQIAPNSSLSYFIAGAEIPLTEFQSATESLE
jgi:phage-related tail fiber protein